MFLEINNDMQFMHHLLPYVFLFNIDKKNMEYDILLKEENL